MTPTHAKLNAARHLIACRLDSVPSDFQRLVPKALTSLRTCSNKTASLYCSRCPETQRTYSVWYCRHRLCPICSHNSATARFNRLKPLLPRRLRWITLSVITDPDLRRQHSHLTNAWSHAMRTRWWKEKIRGGAWSIETTWHQKGDTLRDKRGHDFTVKQTGWHTHYHIIYEGQYIPQPELSDQWKTRTAGSYVVAIGEVKTARGLREVLKYEVKATQLPAPALPEFLTVSRSRRFFGLFGSWHGIPDPARNRKLWKPLLPAPNYTLWFAEINGNNHTRRQKHRACPVCKTNKFVAVLETARESIPKELAAFYVDYANPKPDTDNDDAYHHLPDLPNQPRPKHGPTYKKDLTAWLRKC